MALTPEQQRQARDYIGQLVAGGATYADIANAATQFGVPMDEVYGLMDMQADQGASAFASQPLTQAQVTQARDYMAAQYGPDWMNRLQTPSANQAAVDPNNPSAAYNLASSGLLYDMAGAGQAVGYGNDALGQIAGTGAGYFDRALGANPTPTTQDIIAANGRMFINDTGVGNIDNVQDQYDTTRNPDGSYTTTQRDGGGTWDPVSQEWIYPTNDQNSGGGLGRVDFERRGGRHGGQRATGAPAAPTGAAPTAPAYTAPTLNTAYTPSPYLSQQIGNIGNQISTQFNEQIMPGLRSSAIMNGTYGGAKQGVAEGRAAGDAARAFSDASTNLLGQDYNNWSNRALTQYGMDQGYGTQQRGLDLGFLNSDRSYSNAQRGLDLGFLQSDRSYDLGQQQIGLGYYGADQNYNLGMTNAANTRYGIEGQQNLGNQNSWMNFFNTNRAQDTADALASSNIYSQMTQADWYPFIAASGIYGNASGNNTTGTTNLDQGGGAMGALGGAGAGYQLYKSIYG